MATNKLEERVAALEAEMARLKAKVEGSQGSTEYGMDHIWGTFANDPAFEEAMRYGRQWRESQRPKPGRRRKKQNGRTRSRKGR